MSTAGAEAVPDLLNVDVAFACSLASACGALFIIGNWRCNWAARRLFFLRLIAWMALANLLSACAYIMSFVEWRVLGRNSETPVYDEAASQLWCLIQSISIVIFENASILWTVAIALALHAQVVVRQRQHRTPLLRECPQPFQLFAASGRGHLQHSPRRCHPSTG